MCTGIAFVKIILMIFIALLERAYPKSKAIVIISLLRSINYMLLDKLFKFGFRGKPPRF